LVFGRLEVREKISSLAESLRGDMIAFLREIIAIPSMNGSEGEVVARIKREMEALGYHSVEVDPMGNLLGRIGSGERILAIDGHCDTVGVGNQDNWEIDPFEGFLRGGVLYGRGASDQKGGLAAAVYAGKILSEIGLPENVSVLITATVLEEDYEGVCWDFIIRECRIIPEAVLLTEPTDLQVNRGQRGRLEIKLRAEGISAHGSAPERGVNAIYRMASIVLDIERLNSRFSSDSPLGKGSIVVTDIRSSSPSLCAVADSSTIHLDRRLTEGETIESALREIEALESVRAAGALARVPELEIQSYTGLVYPVRAFYPPWLMAQDDPLVICASESFKQQFGDDPALGIWAFSTNGVATRGVHGIPTIGFGPGEERHAHSPSDQVRVDDVVKAAEFYAAFALHWASVQG
jgi:putative selenium metabolism hydrolase